MIRTADQNGGRYFAGMFYYAIANMCVVFALMLTEKGSIVQTGYIVR